jgi:uncharacterized protein YegP (UPF0339 family)
MSHASIPVELSHFNIFTSAGGYQFNIMGRTAKGSEVVIARSYRFKSKKEALAVIELVRGKNTDVEIHGPMILLKE